jgi:hypothetical protein
MSSLKFDIAQAVTVFDPNMEPLVPSDSVGKVSKIYAGAEAVGGQVGYDVTLKTSEGTEEDFFYFEFELAAVEGDK